MSVEWYLIVSALVFAIGAGGILVRRNPLVILLCLELMLNAGNLALVAFARAHGNQDGQIFALIVMVVAAVGAVILARRRTGLEDPREISVTDLLRSPQTKGTLTEAERGTMLEAGGPPQR